MRDLYVLGDIYGLIGRLQGLSVEETFPPQPAAAGAAPYTLRADRKATKLQSRAVGGCGVALRAFWGRFSAVSAAAGLCAACAMPVSRLPAIPQQALAIEERSEQIAQIRAYYAELARVDNVAFRIRTANRQFCKTVAAQIGLHAATVRSLPSKYRSYTNQALGVSWTEPTVIAVVTGSPAAQAGIKVGDQVLRLNGKPVPATRTQRWIDDSSPATA